MNIISIISQECSERKQFASKKKISDVARRMPIHERVIQCSKLINWEVGDGVAFCFLPHVTFLSEQTVWVSCPAFLIAGEEDWLSGCTTFPYCNFPHYLGESIFKHKMW